MILSLSRKAVFAGKVAVMGHIKAEGFNHCLPFLKVDHCIPVLVLGKKLSSSYQLIHSIPGFQDTGLHFFRVKAKELCHSRIFICLPVLIQQRHQIKNKIIDNMNGTTANVKYDVVTIVLK
jgi:hypothetical protein